MSTRQIAYVAVLAALYVVVGQVVRFIPNPMLPPPAIIALNMVVVVIAGILLGPTAGALVGLIGTFINGFFTPAGNIYEKYAIIPHAIMGLTAGLVRGRQFLAALTIIVGHVLNILAFIASGLLPATAVTGRIFIFGLAFETLVGVIVILLAVPLLRPLVRKAAPAR